MLALGLSESLLAVWDKPRLGGFVGLIEIDAAGGGLDTLTRFSLVTGWLLKKAPGELYGVGLSESVGYIFSR
jgi:hypothetical protein